MKALTLHQPWASLVALGVKTIETRSWSTDHRGPLAIHAAKKWAPRWRGVWVDPWSDHSADAEKVRRYDLMIETLGCYPVEDINGSNYWTTDCRNVPLGAVVATCTLTDCVPIIDGDTIRDMPIVELLNRHGGHYIITSSSHDPVRWHRRPGIDGPMSAEASPLLDQLPLGDFTPGRHAWLLDDIEPLAEPIPARGRQRLWNWDDGEPG